MYRNLEHKNVYFIAIKITLNVTFGLRYMMIINCTCLLYIFVHCASFKIVYTKTSMRLQEKKNNNRTLSFKHLPSKRI